MTLRIEALLLLALFSPLVELLPNLYMSWWLPSNGNVKQYLKTWPRRILIVLTVWFPILIVLSGVTQPPMLIWLIAALVFSAFGLRLFFFNRFLRSRLKKLRKTSRVPEVLYFVAFSTIGWVLYNAVPGAQWLVPTGILIIFMGAFLIGTFRSGFRKNKTFDVIARFIFTTGFLINLYNLYRASLFLS